jgi:predicted RNase H-like HicB family nuclease
MRFALAMHEEAGKYGVTVLDLPGCFAAGDSYDDAIDDARGAIDAHVELLIEDGLAPLEEGL